MPIIDIIKPTILNSQQQNVEKNPKKLVENTRSAFNSGVTKSIAFRKQQLKNLIRFYEENKEIFCDALISDLRRHKQESLCCEIEFSANNVKHILMNLEKWVKPEKPKKDIANWFDGVYIENDPYGVCLVMGAWNYPLHLALAPVAGIFTRSISESRVLVWRDSLGFATDQIAIFTYF